MNVLLLAALMLPFCWRDANSQGASLPVSIRTFPEAPPHPAAIWIDLTCVVDTTSSVAYNWSLFCDDSLLFYFGDPLTTSVRIRSTPTSCLNTVNCTAQDVFGNAGTAIWRTGVGFWGVSQPIANNSALFSDSTGDIGVIHCHSSSTQSNVGDWLSPEREDITLDISDDFIILFSEGSFPSYNTFELLPTMSFSSADEGVYSCIVPDENGVQQTLHIGIYPNGYPDTIQVPAIQRYSQSPLIIECITTGLPATATLWVKLPGIILTQDTTFQMYQELTDAITTTYSNRLVINQGFHEARGLYYCLAQNSFSGPIQDPSGPNTTADVHFFSVFLPGDFDLITCSYDSPTWVNTVNGQTVSDGPHLIIPSVNDSIHEVRYVCMDGPSMIQYTVIVNVPDTALEVTATETTTPMVGSPYGVVCLAAKSISGLINDPVPVWLDSNGNEVIAGGGTALNGPVNTTSSSELTLSFTSLRTSNAGVYVCQGTLDSPALDYPIVKQAQVNITAQIPQPAVTLSTATSPPYSNGNTLTLECAVTVDSAVNTLIELSVSWTRSGVTITNGGRIEISDVTSTGSLMYQSSLTVSSLSVSTDSGVYGCAVSVNPSPASLFITTSNIATASMTITVIGPPLTADLIPSSVDILDISPYNSFMLTCNSTVADISDVITTQWTTQIEGSSIISVLSHNGASVNISNSVNGLTSTSRISIVETVAGNYIYICTSSIQQPGNVTVVSASATITVQGLLFPLQPANVQATVTSFTTATVEWDVPSIAYTPESYTVQYGATPQSLDQTVTVLGPSDIYTEDQHYTVHIMGLRHDTTYYYQVTATSSAGSTATIVLSFTIRDIPIITAITTAGSPIAGNTFSLVCTVTEEEDITGIPVATWLDQTGQSIHSGGDFMITSQLSGLTTTLTLQFAPLRGSHSGEYTCRAELRELSFNETSTHNLVVDVAALPVSINSSSISYSAASPLTLSCQIGVGAVGTVTYRWSSTCTGECFVLAQTTQQVDRTTLRASDSGDHTCTATDELGNTGSASIQVTVDGVGIYLSGAGVLANNTVVLTSPGGAIGNVQCISSTTTPNVGQWIAPNGQDTTSSNTDPFDIVVGGSENPGHLEISLAAGESITSSWEGVYTCRFPEEQVLYVGIHLTAISPSIISLALLANMPSFDLNCTSTGTAASSVTWLKDNSILAVSDNYRINQNLRDGVRSIYDNILEVSTAIAINLNSLVGNYTCRIENGFGIADRDITFRGLEITRNQDVFIVGQSASVTCSSDLGVSSVEWMDSNDVVVVSSVGSSALLEFNPVSDIIHNTRYTCRTVAAFGTQERDINIIAEVDADDISISISSSPIPALIGQDLSLTCRVETPPGLINYPTIRWQYPNEVEIVNTNQVTIGSQVFLANGVSSTVTFRPLTTSHGEDVICLADVTSNAPPHQLSKAAEYDIFVGAPAFPNTPADVLATEVTSTSAVIQWRIPSVTYTPEQYVVRYGVDRDGSIDDRNTVTVYGNEDTSLADQTYTITLTDLRPITIYYFSVSATNSIGTNSTNTLSFMTLETTVMSEVTFQLLLGKVHDCDEWRFANTQDKLADIRTSLLSNIQEECQCLRAEDDIYNAEFTCFDDPEYVVFRATFISTNSDGEQFIMSVEQFIQGGKVTILVQSNRLTIDPECNIKINALNEEFICEPLTDTTIGVSTAPIVGAVVGVIVVVLLLASFIVVLAILLTQRKKKKLEIAVREELALSTAPTTYGNAYDTRQTLMDQSPIPPNNPPPYSMTHYTSEGSYVEMNPAAAVWHTKKEEKDESLYSEIPAQIDAKEKLDQVQFDGTTF